MRASVGRGVGREGGDKALAANTYPNDECKSNYYCGRKRHSKLGPEASRGPSPGSSVGSCLDPDPAPGLGPRPSLGPSPGRGPDPNPNEVKRKQR